MNGSNQVATTTAGGGVDGGTVLADNSVTNAKLANDDMTCVINRGLLNASDTATNQVTDGSFF